MSSTLELKELTSEHRKGVDDFLRNCRYAHHHWEFRSPLAGLGSRSYLAVHQDREMLGVLDCPPGPGGGAWLRLFAADPVFNLHQIWKTLWEAAKVRLPNQVTVNVLASSFWLHRLLRESSFQHINDIVFMERKPSSSDRPPGPPGITIRWMKEKDLEDVYAIDQAAFASMWWISPEEFKAAFLAGDVATVAVAGKKIVGYQISTANIQGAELVRVAVHPEHQGIGVGASLLNHLLQAVTSWGNLKITVNTQKTNAQSIRLYKKFGFTLTKKSCPIFQYSFS
ncbi:MAG: GNAT family N-acetyltransferase [Anaerolineales bacterium]